MPFDDLYSCGKGQAHKVADRGQGQNDQQDAGPLRQAESNGRDWLQQKRVDCHQ